MWPNLSLVAFKAKKPPIPKSTAKYFEEARAISPTYRNALNRAEGGYGGSDNKSSLSTEAVAKRFEVEI